MKVPIGDSKPAGATGFERRCSSVFESSRVDSVCFDVREMLTDLSLPLQQNMTIRRPNTVLHGNTSSGNDISNDGLDNDQDGLIDGEDSDEYGPPRESALKIASKKLSENIIANITSTW